MKIQSHPARLYLAGLSLALAGAFAASVQAAPGGPGMMGQGAMMMAHGPMGGAGGPGGAGGGMFDGMMTRMLDRVNATPEQRTQIRQIMQNKAGDMSAQREAGRASELLLIDDDTRLTRWSATTCAAQRLRGRRRAARWRAGRQRLQGCSYDALLLDLMLPDGDGLDLTRELRADARTRRLPLLMLTARGEPMDRIVGLEIGADDYLPKPFEPRELLARVKALLRRAAPEPARPTRCWPSAAWRSTSARARRAWTAAPANSPATSSSCWPCWRAAPGACCRATRSWTR
jgi:CheY-like chemotaxis protein